MNSKRKLDLYGVAAAALAGLATGAVVAGIGARLAMRAVAVLGGTRPGFTVDGTVAIMLLAGVMGLVVGAIYGVVRPFLPLRGMARGLALGAVLAALIALPFFRDPQGELALATPALGAALFGAVGLAFALALEAILQRWDARRRPEGGHPLNLLWLGLALPILALAVGSMTTLLDEFVRFPPVASGIYLAAGLDFQRAHELHSVLMLGFAIAYLAAVVAILWLSAGRWMGKLAALSLAVLAAGWFSAAPFPAPANPAGVALPSDLLKGVGLALLVLVLFLWPDGRFQPAWTRPAFFLWCGWLVVWLLTPFGKGLPQPLMLATTAAGLASGLLALATRRRDPAQRRQVTPVLVGYGLAMVWFLGLWGAALARPELQVHRTALPATLFAFAPYLAPWLLLPASLLASLSRDRHAKSSLASAPLERPGEMEVLT